MACNLHCSGGGRNPTFGSLCDRMLPKGKLGHTRGKGGSSDELRAVWSQDQDQSPVSITGAQVQSRLGVTWFCVT